MFAPPPWANLLRGVFPCDGPRDRGDGCDFPIRRQHRRSPSSAIVMAFYCRHRSRASRREMRHLHGGLGEWGEAVGAVAMQA